MLLSAVGVIWPSNWLDWGEVDREMFFVRGKRVKDNDPVLIIHFCSPSNSWLCSYRCFKHRAEDQLIYLFSPVFYVDCIAQMMHRNQYFME